MGRFIGLMAKIERGFKWLGIREEIKDSRVFMLLDSIKNNQPAVMGIRLVREYDDIDLNYIVLR